MATDVRLCRWCQTPIQAGFGPFCNMRCKWEHDRWRRRKAHKEDDENYGQRLQDGFSLLERGSFYPDDDEE